MILFGISGASTFSPADILRSAVAAAAASLVLLSSPQLSHANVGYLPEAGRLRPCPASDSNCVSSSYNEPPNRYISPLRIVNDRDEAFRRAVRDLNREASVEGGGGLQIVNMSPSSGYIYLTVPGTSPGSLDDVELLFPEDGGIVNIRAEARVTLPPPPFCLKKGCINGNMDQRNRIERVARILGLPSVDEGRMKDGAKWTPIFFNSDTVPGFYDD